MNVSHRMQKIRLEMHDLTESVERNLKGSVQKHDSVGSIEHEIMMTRRDLKLLLNELRDQKERK